MTLKIGKGASAPPFMVMDVIAAANARQAALPPGAPHVIRMEVGQPGTGAPAGAVAAAQAALRSGHPLGYTEAFGLRSLRHRIARACAGLVWLAAADRAHRGDRGRVRGVSAGVPRGIRSGRPYRHGGAVLPALCQHPDRAGHGPGDPGSRTGNPVPAHRRDAGGAGSAA